MKNIETEIIAFFTELERVQEATMELLQRKQQVLAHSDIAAIKAITEEERGAVEQMEGCLERRTELLTRAEEAGFKAESIERLCEMLPDNEALRAQVKRSQQRTRLIRFQSLTNWVLTQRSLIHLNQLIELIEMKGGSAPTYTRENKRETGSTGGSLVDRVA